MKKEPERLRNRSAVAEYLNITRMTLWRWEKLLPIPNDRRWSNQIWNIETTVIDKWKTDLLKKYIKRISPLNQGDIK